MNIFVDNNIMLIFLVSFVVTFLSICFLRPISKKIGIIDTPSERKLHLGNIPLLGGISIFVGVYVSILSCSDGNDIFFTFIITGFLILLIGLIDDLYPLSVIIRLLAQIIVASSMVYFTELRFETIGHSFGFANQVSLGYLSYPITILGLVFITNVFNLIDGSDGISAGLCYIAIIFLNIIIIFKNGLFPNPISIALTGSLVPFIYFNMIKCNQCKIFLGDSGSLFLGYMIACLLLYETQTNKFFSPTISLWIVAIPIFDAISVMIYRLRNSNPLFAPDRNHLHHYLEKLEFSKLGILFCILSLSLLIFILGLIIEYNFQALSFLLFLCSLLFYVWIRVFSKYSKYT